MNMEEQKTIKKKHNINIPYDNEAKCNACGSVGINMLEEEDIVYGDKVVGTQKVLICECGGVIKVFEDDDEGYDEE